MRTPSSVGMRRYFLQALSMAVVIWGAASPVRAEDPPPPPADRAKVDMAIQKGAEWLEKHAWQPGAETAPTRPGELDWLTRQAVVVKAIGSSRLQTDNPEFIKWSDAIRLQPPRTTLEAALRAQAVEYASTNPIRNRNDLLVYALFLADNQAQDGSWGEGKAVEPPPASMIQPEPVARSESPLGPRRHTMAMRKVAIARRVWGEPGDGFQTGLALLGWMACMRSGLYPEPSAMALTEKWLTDTQNEDGGWGGRKDEPSRLTMTALGMAGLGVCLRLNPPSGFRIDRNERVQKAARWLGGQLKYDHLAETDGPSRWFWLWCVQRAGDLSGLQWFDQVPWYKEGSDWLLAGQREDGSWGQTDEVEGRILDTCWAMLLLRQRVIMFQNMPPSKR
jgi:hypothetical protein